MTPEQVLLVQRSFKQIAPIADVAGDLFYNRLFAIAPEVRQLFPTDLRLQKSKLFSMLATVVGNLQRIDQLLPAVEDLGRRHVAYGVTAAHFEPVGQALLWTLERGLGADFTPAVKAAWTEAYSLLAGAMKEGAEKLPEAA